MNAAVNALYAEYLEHTDGDKVAAASLALAAVLVEANTPSPAGQSMTVKEAAAQLHVSPSCIYELCESGKLSSFKVGRVLRIHPEAIEEYRRQGTVPGRREPFPFGGRPNRCL